MLKGVKITFYLLLLCLFIVLGVFGGYFIATLYNLPHIDQLEKYQPSTITRIYSDEGEVLAEFFQERREVVPLSQIPLHLREAFISIEDQRFYQHGAVDLKRIIGMLWANLKARRIVQGGSTITQQLAKNLFLTQERTLKRKIKELILAIQIERKYSKKEILEMYLNQIYFGQGVYGIGQAASYYLGKEVGNLDIAESAFLSAIPKNPAYYSPFNHPEHTHQRKKIILKKMHELGFINKEEWEEAREELIEIVKNREKGGNIYFASYFAEWIRQRIEEKYGYEALWRGGLKIYTTLDFNLQKTAEEALVDYLEKNNHQGALLAMDPHTGFVKALVGGESFEESQFNRAIQARRQTGSAFKLFTYTAAIDSRKFNPVSSFFDAPITFKKGKTGKEFWSPRNYEGYFWGEVYLWQMFAHSINVSSVKLLEKVGIEKVIHYAHLLGIESNLNPDLTLTLGTSSVSLLEMVRAYATIANYGIKIKPIFIQRIEDREGRILEENFPQGERVLSPQTSYVMIDLLRKTIDYGTGRRVRWLGFHRPCAGKTGTVGWPGEEDTDKTMDAWFIGFTPDLIAGVWIGNDDGSPLGEKITGSVAAIPVWTKFMQNALEGKPIKDFPSPPGIMLKKIDMETGLLATPDCKKTLWLVFLEGTAPEKYCACQKEETRVREFHIPACSFKL
jgi:penicillin-binding protein 1A